MSLDRIIELFVYLLCFGIALYALNGIDFARIMRKGRTLEIQVLYVILSMIIAYLLGGFILTICGR